MSKEKYPYTFSRKTEAIEFIVLQTLFQYAEDYAKVTGFYE